MVRSGHTVPVARPRHRVGRMDVRRIRRAAVQHHAWTDARRPHGPGEHHRARPDVGRYLPRDLPAGRHAGRTGIRVAGRSIRAQAYDGAHDPLLLDFFRAHLLRHRTVARRGVAFSGGARRRWRMGGGSNSGRGSFSAARAGPGVRDLSRNQRPRYVAGRGGGSGGWQRMAVHLHHRRIAGAAGVLGAQQHPRAGPMAARR